MNEIDGYFKTCSVDDLREKTGRKYLVNEVEVAVFKVDGEIFAVSNICPHQHASLMYDGFVENGHVICPAHGWEFSLQTGRLKTGSRGLDSYPVKVIDGQVYIKAFKKTVLW